MLRLLTLAALGASAATAAAATEYRVPVTLDGREVEPIVLRRGDLLEQVVGAFADRLALQPDVAQLLVLETTRFVAGAREEARPTWRRRSRCNRCPRANA